MKKLFTRKRSTLFLSSLFFSAILFADGTPHPENIQTILDYTPPQLRERNFSTLEGWSRTLGEYIQGINNDQVTFNRLTREIEADDVALDSNPEIRQAHQSNMNTMHNRNPEYLVPVPEHLLGTADNDINTEAWKTDAATVFGPFKEYDEDDPTTHVTPFNVSVIKRNIDNLDAELNRRITAIRSSLTLNPILMNESGEGINKFITFLESFRSDDDYNDDLPRLKAALGFFGQDEALESGGTEDYLDFRVPGEGTTIRLENEEVIRNINSAMGTGTYDGMNIIHLLNMKVAASEYVNTHESVVVPGVRNNSDSLLSVAERAQKESERNGLRASVESAATRTTEARERKELIDQIMRNMTVAQRRQQGQELIRNLLGDIDEVEASRGAQPFLSRDSVVSIGQYNHRPGNCSESTAIPLKFLTTLMSDPNDFQVNMSDDGNRVNVSFGSFSNSSCFQSIRFRARRDREGNVFVSAHLGGDQSTFYNLLTCLINARQLGPGNEDDGTQGTVVLNTNNSSRLYGDSIRIQNESSSAPKRGKVYFDSGRLNLSEFNEPAYSRPDSVELPQASNSCYTPELLGPREISYASQGEQRKTRLAREAEEACRNGDYRALLRYYNQLKNLGNTGAIMAVMRDILGKMIEDRLASLNEELNDAEDEEDLDSGFTREYSDLLSQMDEFVIGPLIEEYQNVRNSRGGDRDARRERRDRLKDLARDIRRYQSSQFVSRRAISKLEDLGEFSLSARASSIFNKIQVYGSSNTSPSIARKEREIRRLNDRYEARLALKERRYDADHGHARYSNEYASVRRRYQYYQGQSWQRYMSQRNRGLRYCQANPYTGRPNNLTGCQRFQRNYQSQYQNAMSQRSRYGRAIQFYGALETDFANRERAAALRMQQEGLVGGGFGDEYSMYLDPTLATDLGITLQDNYSFQDPSAQAMDISTMRGIPGSTQFAGPNPFDASGSFSTGFRGPTAQVPTTQVPTGATGAWSPTFGQQPQQTYQTGLIFADGGGAGFPQQNAYQFQRQWGFGGGAPQQQQQLYQPGFFQSPLR